MFKNLFYKFIALMTRAKLAKKAKALGQPITKEQQNDIHKRNAFGFVLAGVLFVAACIIAVYCIKGIFALGVGRFFTMVLGYILSGFLGKMLFLSWLKIMTMIDEECLEDLDLKTPQYERDFSVEIVKETHSSMRWDVEFNNKWMSGKTKAGSSWEYQQNSYGEHQYA